MFAQAEKIFLDLHVDTSELENQYTSFTRYPSPLHNVLSH